MFNKLKRRKISLETLEELAKTLPVIPTNECCSYIGGGDGSPYNPYTVSEYVQMSQQGFFPGGYVDFNGSSIYVYSSYQTSDYLLPEVEVIGHRNPASGMFGYGDDSGYWGISPDGKVREPYGYYPPSNGGGGGGGSSSGGDPSEDYGYNDPQGGTPSEWDDIARKLKTYRIYLKGDQNSVNGQRMAQVLTKLWGSASFIDFLDRVKSHGINVDLVFGSFPVTEGVSRKGLTTATLGSERPMPINEKIGTNVLERPDAIAAASTIVHETIHSRLLGVLEAYKIDPTKLNDPNSEAYKTFHSSEFKLAYPGLYDHYSRYPWQHSEHEMIAQYYRPMIEQILREAFPGRDEEHYIALAWSGLEDTQAWKNLDDNLQWRYKDIIIKIKGI